ncbi:YybH family protein [Pseudomonas indica]|uniref:SnoaL-like domain-containing protein n=1 Tax=Pseudomonas indica TaxID=137658 RepID=A0A1G9JUN0_9PSED|nr:SgcJ/EcaC family oxidoreductase [Pseudomonas indica]MBU3059457.1 SgcJ/EcaC family oxidoreductase [Pseudomonas indica]SDL40854.1 conserved hypothetical protein [Pseudomonas indica]
MTAADRTLDDQARIRELTEQWAETVRSRDVERIMQIYADDVRAFDAVAQLQFKGKAAYKAHWQACMEQCPAQGSMQFKIDQLQVETGGDLGLAHYLCYCGGTDEKGEEQGSWMRVTVGWRRIGGEWKITHDHFSAPFDMKTGETLFKLQP